MGFTRGFIGQGVTEWFNENQAKIVVSICVILKELIMFFSFKLRYMKPQLQINCTNYNCHIYLYLSLKFDNNMIFSIKYVEFLLFLLLDDMPIEKYLMDKILPCIICVIGSIHTFRNKSIGYMYAIICLMDGGFLSFLSLF